MLCWLVFLRACGHQLLDVLSPAVPAFRAQLLKPSATRSSSAGRRPDIACLTRSSLVHCARQVLRGLAFHFRNHAQSLLQDTEIFVSSLAPVETSACLCTLGCRGKAVIRTAMGTGGAGGLGKVATSRTRAGSPVVAASICTGLLG